MLVIYPTKLLSMIMYSKHLMGRWSIYPHDLLIFMVDYIEGKETLHSHLGYAQRYIKNHQTYLLDFFSGCFNTLSFKDTHINHVIGFS